MHVRDSGIDWEAGIQTRPNGSFVVIKWGNPYHIAADMEEFAAEFAAAKAFAAANPEKATPEPRMEELGALRHDGATGADEEEGHEGH